MTGNAWIDSAFLVGLGLAAAICYWFWILFTVDMTDGNLPLVLALCVVPVIALVYLVLVFMQR